MEKSQETISNGTTTETSPIFQGEDVEPQDSDLSPEERIFLKEFPMLKAELEMDIRKHRAVADKIDQTHKNLTQTSLVTNSLAVVSGTMSILGLALAPVTAGGSLMLSAAGQGLGAVAGAASLATCVLECRHRKQAQAQVRSELSGPGQKVKEAVSYLVGAGNTFRYCRKTIDGIRKNMRALEVARAHPHLTAAAKRLLLTGQASARTTRKVQRAFRGTPLAMGSNAFLRSGALAGLFLTMDVSSLWEDWKQLKQGARTELADSLRAQAEELERQLAEFTQLYENLQKLLQGKSLEGSSSEEEEEEGEWEGEEEEEEEVEEEEEGEEEEEEEGEWEEEEEVEEEEEEVEEEEEAGATLPQPPAKQGEAGPRATATTAIAG